MAGDGRTPEQRAADDALTAAIEANLRTYYPDADLGVLTDYLVVHNSANWSSDGRSYDAVGFIPRDNDLPLARQAGLIRYAQVRTDKRISADED